MRPGKANPNSNEQGRRRLNYLALGSAALAAWRTHYALLRPGADFSAFSVGLTTTIGRWNGQVRVELVRPSDRPSEHDVYALAEIDPRTLEIHRLEFDLDGQL